MNPEQAVDCGAIKSPCSTPEGKAVSMGASRRTPSGSFSRVHSSFKSPAQAGVGRCATVSPDAEVKGLQRSLEELDSEIASLVTEGYRLEELGEHIDLLHEYNDIKDIGQSLLGRIAALRGTTTRDLYGHFGLDLND